MSGLEHVSVAIETGNSCRGQPRDFGNLLPVLHQIRHALDRLIQDGDETRIDLNAMPFGPGELRQLIDLLGTGEVRATVEAFGPTLVQETAIPGVWLVDYQNAESERLTLQVEIAPVPEILRPQPLDLVESLATLNDRLTQLQGPSDSPPPS